MRSEQVIRREVKRLYGYYTDPTQIVAAYDPGIDGVPCLICNQDLDVINLRTISLMVPDDSRSYFYRVHRSCHEPLSEAGRIEVDGLFIDAIYSSRNRN